MPKIISIHSYRGGTGKSNSTANLATVIAREGNRVGIVDTDIPSPGIHVLFGLQEEQMKLTLNDYLWGKCSIDKAAYDVTSVLGDQVADQSKIYLVPSSVKMNDISRVLREGYDVDLLFEGFQDLIKKLKLDYLFIDTHPGLNEETLLSLTLSDIVLIVLRPDQQDFQGSAVTVDVARKLNVPKLLLLVNKALEEYDFEKLKEQVKSTYNTQVVGVLPESSDMMRLASSGIFSIKYPDHSITKVLEGVAKQIMS
ncbi:MAG: MinD/ParA family protein [Moorea sp. SIO2B7]|nr:MinD/ParA family protein [Moorena sp. SIO2B7]